MLSKQATIHRRNKKKTLKKILILNENLKHANDKNKTRTHCKIRLLSNGTAKSVCNFRAV